MVSVRSGYKDKDGPCDRMLILTWNENDWRHGTIRKPTGNMYLRPHSRLRLRIRRIVALLLGVNRRGRTAQVDIDRVVCAYGESSDDVGQVAGCEAVFDERGGGFEEVGGRGCGWGCGGGGEEAG